MTVSAVSLVGLTVHFEGRAGRVTAVDDLTFEVAPDEVVCLVGPSGCGKTTALRVVAGLQQDHEGTVSVYGEPVSGPPDGIGVMFQQSVLLDWLSAEDNVALPLRASGASRRQAREAAASLMGDMRLGGFRSSRPYELSGGMQQRVALARALICNPRLLLMDEPFSALDAMTRDILSDYVSSILARERVATILVTHSIQEAVSLGDRVLVLSPGPGRLIADIPVPLPRPRRVIDRASDDFQNAVAQVTKSLGSVFDAGTEVSP